MDTTLYNTKGKEVGKLTLPETVFGVSWNNDLVHQVVTAMQANARTPVAHTKTRDEVSGTGKKPWKQKGTGNARHGSRRSPIWRTGGVAHGPRNTKDFSKKVNKKMRSKALYAVLSRKLEEGEILFVDALQLDAPKAKDAKGILESLAKIKGFDTLATKRKNAACIVAPALTEAEQKSFRNFGNVTLDNVKNLNAATLLKYKYLIISGGEDAVSELAEKKTVSKTS